jgi:hypothetical protein
MTRRDDMSTGAQTSIALLVETFFDEAAIAFQPLVSVPGARWRPQLRHATPTGLELTTPDKIEGFFFAECEFQTPELIGEISFGDREILINTTVSPNGRPYRYGLWEWADALERPDLVPRDTSVVTQVDRVREIVHGMAHGVVELRSEIARAAPATLDRMEAARAKVRTASEEQWRESEHRGTVARADDAFRQQQWDRVVMLLESVEDRLSPAEAQKLGYARKRSTKKRDGR